MLVCFQTIFLNEFGSFLWVFFDPGSNFQEPRSSDGKWARLGSQAKVGSGSRSWTPFVGLVHTVFAIVYLMIIVRCN